MTSPTRPEVRLTSLRLRLRPRLHRLSMLGAAALATLAAVAPARANATRTFRQATAKDFEEGEATGSMVQPTGERRCRATAASRTSAAATRGRSTPSTPKVDRQVARPARRRGSSRRSRRRGSRRSPCAPTACCSRARRPAGASSRWTRARAPSRNSPRSPPSTCGPSCTTTSRGRRTWARARRGRSSQSTARARRARCGTRATSTSSRSRATTPTTFWPARPRKRSFIAWARTGAPRPCRTSRPRRCAPSRARATPSRSPSTTSTRRRPS